MNQEYATPYQSPEISSPENNDSSEELDQTSEANEPSFWSKLPQILRWIGGISLVGSAATFLLGNWMDAEPFVRFYSFFGLTAALTIAGVFCGLRLKEDKGARTFLSLGTTFIPVVFCQVGALILAQVSGSTSDFSESMRLFQFDPIGMPLLVPTAIGALILSTAFAFLGFSAMARPEAKRLTSVYMLANALLLLPFRGEIVVTVIGAGLLAFVSFTDRRLFSKRSTLRSWDGRAMRTLLFVPFFLLLTRNVLLYSVSGFTISLLLGAVAAFCFLVLPQWTSNLTAKRAFQHLSLAPMAAAILSLSFAIGLPEAFLGIDSGVAFFALPFAIAVTALSRYTVDSGRSFRFIAALVAVSAVLIQLSLSINFGPAILAFAVSIGTILLAYAKREKGLLALGVGGTAVSIAYHARFAVTIYQSNLWLSLALTGVAVILCASYIERNWQRLILQGKQARHSLSDWR